MNRHKKCLIFFFKSVEKVKKGAYLYKHAVLARLLARRLEVLLQRLLLGGHAAQLGSVVGLQLVAGLAELALLAVQRLQRQPAL